MKTNFNLLKTLACLVVLFVICSLQPLVAQTSCMNSILELNKCEGGIPAGRIAEYESCVKETDFSGNKELAKLCYQKLINFYDAQENGDKAKTYRDLLNNISPK